MIYMEVALSEGVGTLIEHFACEIDVHNVWTSEITENHAIQTLTESEYLNFQDMHGSTVAT